MLRFHTNSLIKKNFFGKSFFFPNFGRHFSGLSAKKRKVVKIVFYKFRNHFEETHFFKLFFSFWCTFGLWPQFIWHMAQKIPQSCQNCFLRVQTNTLRKKLDFWILLFFIEVLAKFILIFGEKKSTKLTKLLSTRPGEHFDQKQFFMKNSSFFGLWSKLFLTFVKNITESLSKIFLCCIQKNESYSENLHELVSIQHQGTELRLQEKMGKQTYMRT